MSLEGVGKSINFKIGGGREETFCLMENDGTLKVIDVDAEVDVGRQTSRKT